MNPVRLNWPGGEHEFRLGIGELRALQKNCSAGPEQIFNRLRTGHWHIDDIVQVIRLGLVGSGEMTASEASDFILPLIDLHPQILFKITAIAVLSASLLGVEDDPVGEDIGETEVPRENGNSPSSTQPAR